jgi:nitrite reductase (NADH) small subunit/3-phenylpropionate/trans-cinnamate dioxygenase ferredoxin subunit
MAAEFVRVARASDLEPGKGLVVVVKGVRVALFNCDGVFYAIRNTCPHMGGELGEGLLQGDIVTCPWHGWRFNVKTGKSPAVEVVAVRTFPVKVEGDDVYVGV